MCVEASQRRLNVQGFVADLLHLTIIPEGNFDAVIRIDNALPHLDGLDHVAQATLRFQENYNPVGCLWLISEITMHWFARSQLCRGPLSTQMKADEASPIKCGTGSMIVATHSTFT